MGNDISNIESELNPARLRMRMVKGEAAVKGEVETFESLSKRKSELEAEVAAAERELEAARSESIIQTFLSNTEIVGAPPSEQ